MKARSKTCSEEVLWKVRENVEKRQDPPPPPAPSGGLCVRVSVLPAPRPADEPSPGLGRSLHALQTPEFSSGASVFTAASQSGGRDTEAAAERLGNLEVLAVTDNVARSVPLAVSLEARVFHMAASDVCTEPFEAPASSLLPEWPGGRREAGEEAVSSLLTFQNQPRLEQTLPGGRGTHSPPGTPRVGKWPRRSFAFTPQAGTCSPGQSCIQRAAWSGEVTSGPAPESAGWSDLCKDSERVCFHLGPTHSHRHSSIRWPVSGGVWEQSLPPARRDMPGFWVS